MLRSYHICKILNSSTYSQLFGNLHHWDILNIFFFRLIRMFKRRNKKVFRVGFVKDLIDLHNSHQSGSID